ncbi:hypothetical protein HanOQP8_Chr14g0508561 [Helianthus annuus]|nr:hypothetical protein HanHA89_Chr14g0541041 [Helianthus annuus]KAJ0658466.1 hypothetical protein HanOQP8_Chr14g0508561 [Helianthus annuus]
MKNLQVLEVRYCDSLMDVFETQGINSNDSGHSGGGSTNIDEGTETTTLAIPRLEKINVPDQLSNLKRLVITSCNLLQHVFTLSTLDSLSYNSKI